MQACTFPSSTPKDGKGSPQAKALKDVCKKKKAKREKSRTGRPESGLTKEKEKEMRAGPKAAKGPLFGEERFR